jgi:hypothetical protein
MEHSVKVGPIQKAKIYALTPDVREKRVQILPFADLWIAHMPGDPPLLHVVEYVGTLVQSSGLEGILLLREVEHRDVLERDVVEVEIAAELQVDLEDTGQPVPEEASARKGPRQPAEVPKVPKRGIWRIVDEIAPVAVIGWPAAR